MNRDKQPSWLEDFNKKFCSYPKFVPKEALFHPEHKKASKKWHLMNEDEVKAFIAEHFIHKEQLRAVLEKAADELMYKPSPPEVYEVSSEEKWFNMGLQSLLDNVETKLGLGEEE